MIKSGSGLNSNDLAKRGESLIRHSTNRYLTTVRIAFRAKQRRFDGNNLEGKSTQVLRTAKVLGKSGLRLGGKDIDR